MLIERDDKECTRRSLDVRTYRREKKTLFFYHALFFFHASKKQGRCISPPLTALFPEMCRWTRERMTVALFLKNCRLGGSLVQIVIMETVFRARFRHTARHVRVCRPR